MKYLVGIAGFCVLLSACNHSDDQQSAAGSAPVASAPAASPVALLGDDQAKQYDAMDQKQGGACDVDRFEKRASSFNMVGWAAIDTKQGVVPEKVLAKIQIGDMSQYVVATLTDRSDIAERFSSPKLAKDSGYIAAIPADWMKAGNKIQILQLFQGYLYTCGVRSITDSDL